MVRLDAVSTPWGCLLMMWLRRNAWWIGILLFLLWAAASPDAAAEVVRSFGGWLFGDFFPGIAEFVANVADMLPD